MNLNFTHAWSKNDGFGRKSKIVIASILAMVMIATSALAVNTTEQSAIADDQAILQAARVNVKISHSGSRGSASASLERSVYNVGDNLVVNWKGATDGSTGFYIPTEITYGTGSKAKTTVNVESLIKIDQMQASNAAYQRRMNEDTNMTTYDLMKSYVTQNHSVNLGSVDSINTTVTIKWQRVNPVYRLYNTITSEHLFTTNKSEYDSFVNKEISGQDFWVGEGISWLASTSGKNVQRLYNAALGSLGRASHYYTSDEAEIASLKTQGWVADPQSNWFKSSGDCQIWTAYSELLGSQHMYTPSKSEWLNFDGGWDKEASKNGTDGVFQGVVNTTWKTTSNYYKVNHVVAGKTYTQWKAGKNGAMTTATALSFPGYTVSGNIKQTSINGNNTTVTVKYAAKKSTVSFVSNGKKIDSYSAAYGSKLNKTNALSDTVEQDFAYWSLDEAGKVKVNFNTYKMPAGNVTLYAQWTDKDQHTVTFNMSGVGSAVSPQKVINGQSAKKPETPNAGLDWTFVGWFDGTGEDAKEFDFSKPITANTVVFAKWESNIREYNVEHYIQGQDGTYSNSPTTTTTASGRHGESATSAANAKNLEGFSVDTTDGKTADVTIADTEKTTLKIYYKRNTTKVTYVKVINGTETTIETKEGQLFGANLYYPEDVVEDGYIFNGWVKGTADSTDILTKTESVPNQAELKIYASLTKKAWYLAEKEATAATTSSDSATTTGAVKVDAVQLDKDLKILRNPSDANYSTKKTEYENYMKEDKVHLFVKWTGSTVDASNTAQDKNGLLEFRIIQVGAHDNDGSALTFQMTHVIPTAFQISADANKVSEWSDSPLRTKMIEFGTEYKKLVGDVKAVEKKTGKVGSTTETNTTTDEFWIASASEIFGSNNGAGATEGTQYDFFKSTKSVTGTSTTCDVLKMKTRAGNNAKDSETYSEWANRWWTRTADQSSGKINSMVAVSNEGGIWEKAAAQSTGNLVSLDVAKKAGLVVCFAL